MKTLNLLVLLLVGFLSSCSSTKKVDITEARKIQKVGVVVLGADAIHTGQRAYVFPKSYYGRAIEKVIRSKFQDMGYESVTLNPVTWPQRERYAQMKYLSDKYQLSHFFIVWPDKSSRGFALNSGDKAAKISAGFQAEFYDAKGKVLSRSELKDMRALPLARVSKVNSDFDKNSPLVKNASLDYFQKQLPKFSTLVTNTGLLARMRPVAASPSRSIASVGKSKSVKLKLASKHPLKSKSKSRISQNSNR